MIEVTEKAIEKISGIIENDEDYSAETTLFRIQVTGKTATDYKYGIGLEFRKDDYTETESFFNLEKFSMVVDERSLRILDGATVDYKDDLNVQGFDIINPNKPEASDLEERIMVAHDTITITPYTIHRMEGLEESIYLEASTPHIDDVVRIEDDYNREENK